MTASKRFGAVIVNYNCASLALDAALSFLGAGGAKAIIVDNASPDGSLARLRGVVDGEISHQPQAPEEPIAGRAPRFATLGSLEKGSLAIVAAPANGGFARGCNIGLRALGATTGLDRYLLLNPDALVAEGALEAFAARLDDARAGLCGATVVGFEAPHLVQAFGGARLDRVLLRGLNIGAGAENADTPDRRKVEAVLDYPLGAAIALRRDYLSRAGYLDERYFLYFEEADWALAGGPASRPAWAPGAVIYHRYGASSQSRKSAPDAPSERSPLADYHMARSRTLFAAKWSPWLLPVSVAAGVVQATQRLSRGRFANARAVVRGALPGAPRRFVI